MLASQYKAIAKTIFGAEEILTHDLTALGATDVQILNRAVSFTANKELLYKANLYLTTALRIIVPIHEFKARNEDELYEGIQKVTWQKYFTEHDTFAIDSVVGSDYFNHSQYVSLKTKDAIADQFRERCEGVRPSVDLRQPTVRIHLHILGDVCSVALDSSGESLHKRGYRKGGQHEAPLNEVLAATLVRLTGWDGQSNFADPMCGSGTIVTEAGLFALNIAPGLLRDYFGFKNWPDFDAALWEKLCNEARERINHDWEYTLSGSDMSEKYVELAMLAAEKTGIDECVKLKTKRFEENTPPPPKGLAIFNPPYGERLMGEDRAILDLYKTIGDTLKSKYKGYDVWILTSNMEAIKHIGLRPSRKISLFNGSLECKFLKFSIYEGSLKAKYQTLQGE